MHVQRKILLLGLSMVLGSSSLSVFAQNSSGQTEIPLVAAAHAAFSRDKVIHSVHIDGNAKAYAGRSTETGTVSMTANVTGANSFELRMSNGPITVSQSEMKAGRTCTWSGPNGKIHQFG